MKDTPHLPTERVVRYLDEAKFPAEDHNDVVALLDESKNLLLVRRDLYDRLNPLQQDAIIKTQRAITTATDLGHLAAL